MRIKNRIKSKPDAIPSMDGDKVVVENGFVVLSQPTETGFDTIRKDIFESMYQTDKIKFTD